MASDASEVWTIIVAAGSGHRFGRPKQFELLDDRTVLEWSLATARAASDGVVVVLPPGMAGAPGTVVGGATRSDSVRSGLAAVPSSASVICVHDAARPFATVDLYAAVVAAIRSGNDGAVPGVPVTDTIKIIGSDGAVVWTPDRSTLVAVQTPQGFSAAALRGAHAGGGEGTDDAALVEGAGGTVVVVDGEAANRKITLPEDLEWARAHLERRA